MATEKSKILIIGGTGYLGKYIVEASLKAGHTTFALVRESAMSDPAKFSLIEKFKSLGAVLIHGDVADHGSLVKAVKQVDVVISSLNGSQTNDQIKIIEAIKEAGNIKRFLPSEFGADVDRGHPMKPAAGLFRKKAEIRRIIEAEGIPHTFACCYGFAGQCLSTLAQEGIKAPPRDRVVILGDGNAKTILVAEEDIASYTIKAVGDPRTLNKTLYMIPPANVLSFNEVVSMWEKKIGKELEKIYVPEDQVIKTIQESPFPRNYILSIRHYAFVKGIEDELALRQPSDAGATELYPEVKYTTVEDYLDRLV